MFGEKPKSVSYSSLLEQIRNGDVSTLELVPARREVRVTYPDGTKSTVSIFVNDQQILRAAEASATPLTVRDIRGEQAMAGLLGNLGLVLLLIAILSLRLFFRDVNTTTPDEVNFPVEGTNVVVRKVETFWRKVDREKDLGVQLSTQFIPAADITLKSSKSGSLRFFFESPEGDRVGDPVTLTFSNGKFDGSGDAAASIHATGGLEDLGDYNEYLTEKVHFWYLIITEGAGLEAEGSSYEQIIRMPISPKRR